jgi:hypothetical protein
MSRIGRIIEDANDPDRHLWPAPGDEFNAELSHVLTELKAWDTGRWDYAPVSGDEGITLSGKNADLDRGGQQGIQLVSADEEHVYFRVHAGMTIAGNDVCLNLRPRDLEDEDYCDRALELYLEQATEVVCAIPFSGYWSGDDWYVSLHGEVMRVPWEVFENHGQPEGLLDYGGTAAAIVKAAHEALEDWERETNMAHDALDILAGWAEHGDEPAEPGDWRTVELKRVPPKTDDDPPLTLMSYDLTIDEPPDQFRDDVEADADALASAGLGTDEDYGFFGDDDHV